MKTRIICCENDCPYEVHVLLDHRDRSQVADLMASSQTPERQRFRTVVRRMVRLGLEIIPQYDLVDATNKIWKIHITRHIRVYCFRDEHRMILTNAERKTRKQDNPHSLPRAIELRQRYLAERTE